MVDIRQPLQTVSGEPVTLFSTTLKGTHPLGGVRSGQTVDQWTAEGFKINARTPDPLDLVNAPPSRGFVNVSPSTLYATTAEADAAAPPDRIARLAVKFINGQLDG